MTAAIGDQTVIGASQDNSPNQKTAAIIVITQEDPSIA
jgi:hypothetical protein